MESGLKETETGLPRASVVIASYNRARSLDRCLAALIRQSIGPERFELVVVDDGSQDDTREVCGSWKSRFPCMKTLRSGANLGLASAANLGIRSSVAPLVLFTDDDCLPRPDWVGRMCAALDRRPVVAGAVESPPGAYIKLCHNVAHFHPFMGRRSGTAPFIAGANMGFRRTVLDALGGFEERRQGAPDMEFILRARQQGFSIYYDPLAVVLHDHDRTTPGALWRTSKSHAAVTIHLRNRYRDVLNTPFPLRSPAFLLPAAPIIALKATLEAFLRNPSPSKPWKTAPAVYALKLAWCWGALTGLLQGRSDGKPGFMARNRNGRDETQPLSVRSFGRS